MKEMKKRNEKKKERELQGLSDEFCFLGPDMCVPIINRNQSLNREHTDDDEKKKRNNLLFLLPPLRSL
jgi:hypothetical protein